MSPKRTDWKRARKAFGQHLDKYHISLGQFVTAFSQVEATLLRTVWVLARLEAPYAQAILSGVHIDGAISYVRRIAEAEEWDVDKWRDWKRVFDQLAAINRLRNDLLHFGAAMVGDVWVVSNVSVAHRPQKVREIYITPKILDAATRDLGTITLLLTIFGGERVGTVYGMKPHALERLRRAPWRYRPQQPGRPPSSRHRTADPQRKGHEPPPASSRE